MIPTNFSSGMYQRLLRKTIFLIFLLSNFLSFGQKSEKTYYGIGGLYNFQTNGAAADVRARIPLYKEVFVSPRFAYFPASNIVHEYYLGLDLGYQLMRKHKFRPYAYLAGYYNNWTNTYEYAHKRPPQLNNFVFEGGAGITLCYKCLRPYIEYRYDTKWLEGSVGAGILFNWKCCFRSKRLSEKTCPAFKKKKFLLF
jgi:hypothetical protein